MNSRIATVKQSPFHRRISLYPDRIERGRQSFPLAGVHAEVTASGGVLAGTRFLSISGPDFAWTQRTDGVFEGKCRRFAAQVNAAVSRVGPVS